ncbi:bile acid:sodium symporter family protein [Marinobacter sp. BGYM27]|uniref:bile acid:sodium symporter family protein n=1 Tax=Marinobacter sp. BGYM27 TaxID=2975597 RepID=UPI0021A463AA|nr:bile acid:sodium symporter family protein [Marinobacter sp. BGYM27]MDG5499943.1 bile acid:sodium symporter family protein [Marinobacter sp. BGYM27]
MTSSVFSQIVLPVCLFIIMFGMGLSLRIADFTRVARFPKAAILGTVGQMIVLPLAGFALAAWLMPTPALAVGLVLIAACPGGITSNLVAYLARADLALSISLTAISSLLTTITIPLIAGLALTTFAGEGVVFDVPVGKMMAALFAITLLPVLIGMLIKAKSERMALWLEPKINLFGALFLVFLIIVILIEQGESVITQVSDSGVAALALNVVMMTVGLLMARAFRLNSAQSTSITIEIGIQNSTLAMMVATTFLHDPAMAVPAAVYSIMMYLTGSVVIGVRRWQLKSNRQQTAADLA